MKQLFPLKQVMGYVLSLVLTIVALSVLVFDSMSAQVGMIILLVTAFAQASMQIVFFMHIGESEDRKSLYTNIWYALFIALVTIFGTLLTMIWGYQ